MIAPTQILIVALLFIVFISRLSNKLIGGIASCVCGVYLGFEFISIYMTGNPIDYRFFYHLNVNTFEGYRFQFNSEILLFTSSMLLFCLLIYKGAQFFSQFMVRRVFILLIGAFCLGVLSLPGGVLSGKGEILNVLNAPEKNFEQALEDLKMSSDDYVVPDQVTATKGKNIIVISVESLEQGFLGDDFRQITPNLRRMTRDWTFYRHMPVGPGGRWTAASLYNYQTGVPAFFKGQGNDFFQGTTSVKLTGLGHILGAAGYDRIFLAGKPEFAGMDDMVRAYGIEVVSERNALGSYPEVPYGLNDYDLFNEAKRQTNKFMESSDKPFALFISTANTHFPNGIYDKRMEKFVAKNRNTLEFSVAAVDYLIDNFIVFLEQKNLLQNTAIFIFPDHLLMGKKGSVIEKFNKKERQLYLLTNVEEGKFFKSKEETLYQIDLPKMILDGAGIVTNGKFLTDFIPVQDVLQYLKDNTAKIASLNSASLSRKDFQGGITVELIEGVLSVRSKTDCFEIPVEAGNLDKVCDLTFNPEMVLIGQRWIYPAQAFSYSTDDTRYNRLHLLIKLKNSLVEKVYLGDKSSLGLFKNADDLLFSKTEVAGIIKQNNIVADKTISAEVKDFGVLKETIELNSYSKNQQRFIAHAGGEVNGHRYTNSLEALDFSYRRGFRLFELDIIQTSDKKYVAAHDWQHWADITGFKGALPPKRSEFLRHKIFGQFTPLDLDAINLWFGQHPDATLVTDKINKPGDFSSKFAYKDRLMMELFTWDAVKEGVSSEIKSAMPTGNLLNQIEVDEIDFLKQLGVSDIASSRHLLVRKEELLRTLGDSGIHVYAFHVNHVKGIDENYVVCNERKFFYGIYADNWAFSEEPDCSKMPLLNGLK